MMLATVDTGEQRYHHQPLTTTATTHHLFASSLASLGLYSSQCRLTPCISISYISAMLSFSRVSPLPPDVGNCLKKSATMCLPVWKPATIRAHASGVSLERKWAMERARFRCCEGIQRQSAATILVKWLQFSCANASVTEPHSKGLIETSGHDFRLLANSRLS